MTRDVTIRSGLKHGGILTSTCIINYPQLEKPLTHHTNLSKLVQVCISNQLRNSEAKMVSENQGNVFQVRKKVIITSANTCERIFSDCHMKSRFFSQKLLGGRSHRKSGLQRGSRTPPLNKHKKILTRTSPHAKDEAAQQHSKRQDLTKSAAAKLTFKLSCTILCLWNRCLIRCIFLSHCRWHTLHVNTFLPRCRCVTCLNHHTPTEAHFRQL